jgi:catechol 2,3-dioxygenase-like lactoylglutathione lyase family enzyme
MFDHISSLAVYVTELERAKKFYTEVLGFEVSADLGPTLCFLRSKTGKVNIYLEGGHKPATADADTARLGFFLEPPDSVHKVFETLKKQGVNPLQSAPEQVGDDTWWFQFPDPDRNILEVSGKK